MEGTTFSILMFVLGLVFGIIILLLANYFKNKKDENKALSIIESAKKEADIIKKEAVSEAKEEAFNLKQDMEAELKEKKNELKESENRIIQRENNIDRRDIALQNRENLLDERENNLVNAQKQVQEEKEKMEELKNEQLKELQRISKLSREEARDLVMKRVEEDMEVEIATYIKEKENEANLEVNNRAKDMLVMCMQKYAADVTNEQTVSVITLPNDEMKGRIIGREGRNVRTIEAVTGVDLIIDDTPITARIPPIIETPAIAAAPAPPAIAAMMPPAITVPPTTTATNSLSVSHFAVNTRSSAGIVSGISGSQPANFLPNFSGLVSGTGTGSRARLR